MEQHSLRLYHTSRAEREGRRRLGGGGKKGVKPERELRKAGQEACVCVQVVGNEGAGDILL